MSLADYAESLDLDITAAIERAAREGRTLCTYSDPVAEGVTGCSVDYAIEVAAEDPSLVYIR